MKRCKSCGARMDDQTRACVMCGSTDLEETVTVEPTQQVEPVTAEGSMTAVNNDALEQGNWNILAGAVGAFLFSIIGGALYFVIYQAGIIAGICGLVIFTLANFGYGLFARTKNKASIAGLISSVAATVVMIFLAEYFCISFEIYQAFKEFEITIFDAIRATPDFLAEAEIRSAFTEDLVFAYIFGLAASISTIVSIVKARKKQNNG